MKNILRLLVIFLPFWSCNNAGDGQTASEKKADSIYREVDHLHASAMAKSFQMEAAQKKLQAAIDSINRLAPSVRDAGEKYKFQLDSLLNRMKYAGFAMEKWMQDFKWDSATSDAEKRIEYLLAEKNKVERVKEIIVNNVIAADSILKR